MKTVVISGANRGIGLALCAQYQQQGVQVYALCRQTSVQLEALGIEVVEGVDVASEQGLEVMCEALAGQQIDVLINNAGILRDEVLGHIDRASISEQFTVNALAPLMVVDALQHQLAEGAKVAFITSRMGSIADNTSGGRYGYRMSKSALNAAAVSVAHDFAPRHISVGIYHPGYVQTQMVGGNGDISAQEAARRLHGLIEGQTQADTGVFKHSNGEVLPW
ncbi:MAG: SDR family NAD(P)-dependent oxidoreductase [Pseudomonadales bacterium]